MKEIALMTSMTWQFSLLPLCRQPLATSATQQSFSFRSGQLYTVFVRSFKLCESKWDKSSPEVNWFPNRLILIGLWTWMAPFKGSFWLPTEGWPKSFCASLITIGSLAQVWLELQPWGYELPINQTFISENRWSLDSHIPNWCPYHLLECLL